MKNVIFSTLALMTMLTFGGCCASKTADEAKITVIGHGSLRLEVGDKIIQVDPYGEVGDYSAEPKADLVLITHEHSDHLDSAALSLILKPGTEIISTEAVAAMIPNVQVMKNGDKRTWNNIEIEAMPAYNIVNLRPDSLPFHPKGSGNGYMLTIGGKRLYIAGDTELIPEMNAFGPIDIAFVPKNLPYTMSDEMFIEAVKVLNPKEVYPYHYFEINREALQNALPDIIVR